MAKSLKEIRTKNGVWKVDINPRNIIGNGSYGIVYCGTSEKDKKKIAAKRIDTKQKKKLTQSMKHLVRLTKLDHENIVKVRDVHEEEGVVWIFMDLCQSGDLNTFFSKKKLTQEQLLNIMEQIAAGIAYLHDQDIIHRDIKPGNILVANASDIQVQLADFDLSKFLDRYFQSSGMSTNVGTLAFKAPEFFKRDANGKIRYYSTIDVYACGLTYLALTQSQGKEKLSLPQIETPMDDSELHAQSIGQLIADRIKYKVGQLNVIDTARYDSAAGNPPGVSVDTEAYDITNDIRAIILHMTKANPDDRWSPAQVVKELQSVEQKMKTKQDKSKVSTKITSSQAEEPMPELEAPVMEEEEEEEKEEEEEENRRLTETKLARER